LKLKELMLVAYLFVITGCLFITPHETYWQNTKLNNSESAYEIYLRKYPNGPHSDEARIILDDMYFQEIKEKKQHPSHYLNRFPNGKHADEARFIIAEHKNTLVDYNDFLKNCPDGPFADKARSIVESIESQFFYIDSKTKKNPNSTAIIEDWHGNIIEVVGDINFTNICMREVHFSNTQFFAGKRKVERWGTKQLMKFPGIGISTQQWGLINPSNTGNNNLCAIDIYLSPESILKYDVFVIDRVMYFRNHKEVCYYKLLDADSQRYFEGKSINGEFRLDMSTIKRFQKFDDQPVINFSIFDGGHCNNADSYCNVILTTKHCGKLSLGKIYLRVGLCTKPGYTYNSNFCRNTYAFERIPLKISDKNDTVNVMLSDIQSLNTLDDYSDKKLLNIITKNGESHTGIIDLENLYVPDSNSNLENVCSEGILGEASHHSYLFIPFREVEKIEKL
jgi:hypothetical protein